MSSHEGPQLTERDRHRDRIRRLRFLQYQLGATVNVSDPRLREDLDEAIQALDQREDTR